MQPLASFSLFAVLPQNAICRGNVSGRLLPCLLHPRHAQLHAQLTGPLECGGKHGRHQRHGLVLESVTLNDCCPEPPAQLSSTLL
jgi:hypothetical protein